MINSIGKIKLLSSQRGVVHHMLAIIIVVGVVLILVGAFAKTKRYGGNDVVAPSQLYEVRNNISSDDVRKMAYKIIDLQADIAKAAIDESLKAWDRMDSETKEKFLKSFSSPVNILQTSPVPKNRNDQKGG